MGAILLMAKPDERAATTRATMSATKGLYFCSLASGFLCSRVLIVRVHSRAS